MTQAVYLLKKKIKKKMTGANIFWWPGTSPVTRVLHWRISTYWYISQKVRESKIMGNWHRKWGPGHNKHDHMELQCRLQGPGMLLIFLPVLMPNLSSLQWHTFPMTPFITSDSHSNFLLPQESNNWRLTTPTHSAHPELFHIKPSGTQRLSSKPAFV